MSTSFGPANSREPTGPVRTGVPGPGRPGSSPDAVVLAVPPVEERRKSTPKNAFNRSPRSSKSPSYSAGSDLGVMIFINVYRVIQFPAVMSKFSEISEYSKVLNNCKPYDY